MYTAEENKQRKEIFDWGRSQRFAPCKTDFRYEFGNGKIVKKAVKDYYIRKKNNKPLPTELQLFKDIFTERVKDLAIGLPDSGYSMGEEKYLYVKHLGQVSYCDCREYYSRRCSYKAKHGEVKVELPISLVSKLELANRTLFLRGRKINKRIWKCKVVEFEYKTNGRGIINGVINHKLVNRYMVECQVWKSYEDDLSYRDSTNYIGYYFESGRFDIIFEFFEDIKDARIVQKRNIEEVKSILKSRETIIKRRAAKELEKQVKEMEENFEEEVKQKVLKTDVIDAAIKDMLSI